MGKIVVTEFISLDGVVEEPQNWHFPFVTDDMQQTVVDGILAMDVALYGRVTYDVFAGFWPNEHDAIADKLNSVPKYVVSTTLQKADWNNSTLIKTNVPEEIARLKQRFNGDIAISGSVTLIRSLMQANLIDEYQLFIHPIVVGNGKRLFNDGLNTQPLKLVDTKVFSGGVILATYQAEK